MAPDVGFDLDRLAPEPVPGLRLIPVVHDHVECTPVLRAALDRLDPGIVAVELPTTLEAAAIRAVRRLPRISLIVAEHPGADAVVWVVTPAEPLAEAIRWAIERNRKVACIDPDLAYSERHSDPVPDPHALFELGPERYFAMLRSHYQQRADSSRVDRQREAGMAFHLDRLRGESASEPIVACVGAAHIDSLADLLRKPTAHPLARPRRASIELRHLAPRSLTGLLPDPPLAHAVWERARTDETPPEVDSRQAAARKISVVRFGLRVIQGEKGEASVRRRRRIVDLAWSRCAARNSLDRTMPSRPDLERTVWSVAADSYREQTDESLATWQRRMFFEFSRRYAHVQGRLAGGLYEWVVAARGVADDNLAWEVFDVARTYPWQEDAAEIPSVDIDGSELDLGSRRVRFRRRFRRIKDRPRRVPVRERPEAEDPEDWLAAFDTTDLCSYPPEDVVIEDYGSFLQRKAISLLAEERSRVEPFSTSLLDGIEIRETLQNLHEGRIYVQERGRVPGEAGAVVIVFDTDSRGDAFPFTMTWLGEHDQESDMAFYATDPTAQVVGPGIMRATYGGLMLTQPRGRLFDVWADPDYRFCRTRAEILTMAAIDYSVEKVVVHVSPDPPGEALRSYARLQSKILKHVPLAALSPGTLRKVRVFHILAGRDKRELAPDFIW